MYLEISPRQSGKTTRLCLAVKEYLLENRSNIAFIHTMNMDAAKCIEDYLLHILTYHLTTTHLCSSRINRDLTGFRIPQNEFPVDRFFLFTRNSIANAPAISPGSSMKVFADEFDFFGYETPLDKHGYYVTTPKTTRTLVHKRLWLEGKREDFLLDLVKMNGGKTEKFSTFVFKNYTDTISNVPSNYYDTEFLGNWDG